MAATNAKHIVGCHTRDSRFRLAVPPILRKALHEESGRGRGQEQDQEARLQPRVLALEVSAESEM